MTYIYEGKIAEEIKHLEKALARGEDYHPTLGFNNPKNRSNALLTAALVVSAMAVAGCIGQPANEGGTVGTSSEQLPPTFDFEWKSHYRDGSNEDARPIKHCPDGNYTDGDFIKFLAKFDDPNGLKRGTLNLYQGLKNVFSQSVSYDGTPMAKPPSERGVDSDKINFLLGQGEVEPGNLTVNLEIEDQLEDVQEFEHKLNATFIPKGQKAPCE